MKILYLCHRMPYPPARGGKIRPFHMIRHFHAAGHAVHLATLARSKAELADQAGLRPYTARIMVERVYDGPQTIKMVSRIPRAEPSSMAFFGSRRLFKRVQKALKTEAYDLIFVFSSSMGPYVEAWEGCPKIIDFADMDSQKWIAYGPKQPFPLSLGYYLEGFKMQLAETRLLARFDAATVTTAAELASLHGLQSGARSGAGAVGHVLPSGVDPERFSPSSQPYDPDLVVFVGRMDYFPNQECVIRFARETLPLLQARRPKLRFQIVGASPSREVWQLMKLPGVDVTGSVASVQPYVQRALCTVAPLAIARGTQNKILESMSMGVPVVASHLAAAGVDAVAGEHLIAASSPEDTASAIERLIDDPAARAKLSEAGLKRVRERHSWPAFSTKLDAVVAEGCARWAARRQRPARGLKRASSTKEQTMTAISIFGLGYVGAVSLGCLVRDGHRVIGCDIDPEKLRLLAAGQSPIVEAGMAELIAAAKASGRMSLTEDAQAALLGTEISLISVGTPSLASGGQDLSAVRRVFESLGEALAQKREPHLFVLRSTVLPGTTRDVVIPILEAKSGKKLGEGFSVAFQPEFLREGSSISDYDRPPFTVVGSTDPAAIAQLKALYGHLPSGFFVTSIELAETLKMFANSFHALKIGFANEVGRVSQAVGVNAQEVMALLCEDRQLNISPAYLKPGFAFGGSCLPKDVRALCRLARDHNESLPILEALLPSNRLQIQRALDWALRQPTRKLTLFGLSFKSGTDDLRESPLVILAEQLIGKGFELCIYDPEVELARLLGANRRFIEGSVPHLAKLLGHDLEAMIASAELLVLGLNNPEIQLALARHGRPEQRMLDLVGLQNPEALPVTIEGICW